MLGTLVTSENFEPALELAELDLRPFGDFALHPAAGHVLYPLLGGVSRGAG